MAVPQGRNEPAELPRIAQQVADLRGITALELAEACTRNAIAALPKLAALI
jgi:TatD DNase family protein